MSVDLYGDYELKELKPKLSTQSIFFCRIINYIFMSNILKAAKEDFSILLVSVALTTLIFSAFYAYYVYAAAVSLTVTVNSTLSFTTSTDVFPALTPGTSVAATTTLSVATNNAAGWNVTLSCDEKTTTVACGDLDTDTTVELPDPTIEWSIAAAAATTTAGNAAAITNGDNFLYFRMMSASGSVPFRSTAWWGTSDDWFNASQLWAGIASSTNARRIGNAGAGSYSASTHLNTVNYYLDVAASQQTGAYSIPLTYTATAN